MRSLEIVGKQIVRSPKYIVSFGPSAMSNDFVARLVPADLRNVTFLSAGGVPRSTHSPFSPYESDATVISPQFLLTRVLVYVIDTNFKLRKFPRSQNSNVLGVSTAMQCHWLKFY